MKSGPIILPNEVVFAEVEGCLQRGEKVSIPLRGRSMEPLLQEGRDVVILEPITREIHKGDVVLFRYQGRYILHRVMQKIDTKLILQGDACSNCEQVELDDVVGLLCEVLHADGTAVTCSDRKWVLASRRAVLHNRIRNMGKRYFNRRIRKHLSPIYFVCLFVLMWAPMGFMGLPLNNFVFGIRLDHLLHASIYIPCAWFLMDTPKLPRSALLIAALSVALITETGQYFLPYRGFDINDLVANFMGVTFGWLLLLMMTRKR